MEGCPPVAAGKMLKLMDKAKNIDGQEIIMTFDPMLSFKYVASARFATPRGNVLVLERALPAQVESLCQ